MPLLLRLLLCLTLLANTAGGAWAAPRLGGLPAAVPQATAAGCHDGMAMDAGAAMPHDAGHMDMAKAKSHGGHDAGCCAQAGCDCLQHCGTSISLFAPLALSPPTAARLLDPPAQDRGLPRPYQPVRPPIA